MSLPFSPAKTTSSTSITMFFSSFLILVPFTDFSYIIGYCLQYNLNRKGDKKQPFLVPVLFATVLVRCFVLFCWFSFVSIEFHHAPPPLHLFSLFLSFTLEVKFSV